MSEKERIRQWMDVAGHTISSLAKEIGMSYDGVYQALNVRGRVSDGFKLRFINRFGIAAATEVFDLTPGNGAPTPTLAPVAELVTK